MVRKILIAAGGSGGHLFPAASLAEELSSDSEILFAGYKLQNSPFFESKKWAFQEIAAAPLKRGFVRAAWKGFWQSVRLLRTMNPNVVVGFGSYHVFPILLAAAVLRKKIVLFEANSTLGKVNRLFAPVARNVAFQFPLDLKRGVLVPYLPWKKERKKEMSQAEARRLFGLDPEKMTVLVFGGSQGAAFLNEWVPKALPKHIQAIHLTGKGGRAMYDTLACVKEFEKEMPIAYRAADFAICRSGAGTAAELIQERLPALLIPFPYASDDHQRKNGEWLVKMGGFRLLSERDAGAERLQKEILALSEELDEKRSALEAALKQDRERIPLGKVVRDGF
jgi:UDP-N-acetylglucosamine--N-acetylmuramyl-(pentapeptide) pyrophosphoryl-undecaprenol N-acetylglucosamine transferase